MAYRQIKEAIANRNKTRDVDAPLSGTRWELGNGSHTVTIVGVDLAKFETTNRIDVLFENDTSTTHRQAVWLTRRADDGTQQINRTFEWFLAALFSTPEGVDKVFESLDDELLALSTFSALKGLRLKITVGPGAGYRTHMTKGGKYVVSDALTNRPLLVKETGNPLFTHIPQEFPSVKVAREAAAEAGLKRSFNRVKEYEAIDDTTSTENWKIFNATLATLKEARERYIIRRPAGTGSTETPTSAPNSGIDIKSDD